MTCALVWYVARAAVSLQRLSLEADGTVRVQLKGASRSGRTHVRLRPEVFVLRLASLLLPPGVNRVRYFGVFAPAAALRRHVVPAPPPTSVSRRGGRWLRRQVPLRQRPAVSTLPVGYADGSDTSASAPPHTPNTATHSLHTPPKTQRTPSDSSGSSRPPRSP